MPAGERRLLHGNRLVPRRGQKMRGNPTSACERLLRVRPRARERANKTQMRPGESARIRGLGGQRVHAMAEINWNAWNTWVAQNGNGTFFEAGVEARKRMLAVGYDLAAGDTWALNELPSSARTNTGTVRADRQGARPRPLLRRRRACVKGAVLIVASASRTRHHALAGEPQELVRGLRLLDRHDASCGLGAEVYGDYAGWRCRGPRRQRHDRLINYLEYQISSPGPRRPRSGPARTFSRRRRARWRTAPGRRTGGTAGRRSRPSRCRRWWRRRSTRCGPSAPSAASRRITGASPGRRGEPRASRTRLRQPEPRDPRPAGGGDPRLRPADQSGRPRHRGVHGSCTGDLPGATFTVWKSFRTWTQPVLTFTSPPQTVAAGAPSGPIALTLLNATGAVQPAQSPITITLRSSSPRGQFSLAPTGPWTPTLALSIPAGSSATEPFYYLDTGAGIDVTASASGVTSGTQSETILPGAPVSMRVTTGVRTVAAAPRLPCRRPAPTSTGTRFP